MVKIMQKKEGSRIGRLFGSIFNVKQWSDWDRSKSMASYLKERITLLFVFQEHDANTESFEAAKKRMNLDDKQLAARGKSLFRLAWLMFGVAVLVVIYAIYQLLYGTYQASLSSIVLALVSLSLFFRYHFWYFQIKSKKLGCTLSEWFYKGLLGR